MIAKKDAQGAVLSQGLTLADGDWPIQASIGGALSPAGIVLSVAHLIMEPMTLQRAVFYPLVLLLIHVYSLSDNPPSKRSPEATGFLPDKGGFHRYASGTNSRHC